jgi:CBS domain-containing protein
VNSEVFIKIFAQIEEWLRKKARADRSVSFYQLVEHVASQDRSVVRYKDDLKEFADLRNAIVHERTDGHVIAEPNDLTVCDFDRIRAALLNPPAVIPRFQRSVQSRNLEDAVGKAVSDMRSGSFSQLPILSNGKVTALLTSDTIVRWLASEVTNDLVSLMDTKISTVLPHTEDFDHYCFLSRHATLHEALVCFEDFTARGKTLNAILISQDGKPEQFLLGILNVYDLPSILKTLGLRRVSATG